MHLNRGPLKPGPSMTIGIFIVSGFKTKGQEAGDFPQLLRAWSLATFTGGKRKTWPSLWASSLKRSGGRAGGRKESLQLCLWNLNSTSNSPEAPCQLSCQISAKESGVETSVNVNKHWKTRAKGNDIIANVISTNQHFASTFSMQIFKFQRCSCKLLSFFFPGSLFTG